MFSVDKTRKHLNTEIAFSYLKMVNQDLILFSKGLSYVTEVEKLRKQTELVRELSNVSQRLI